MKRRFTELVNKLRGKSDRYDVWAVDEQGRKYDIECQTTRQSNIIERMYRYLLKLQSTVEPLLPGEKVPKGHASYAICFGTYNPGQKQRARYSISMHDDERLDQTYDNLGHIVMFNTKAKDRSMISSEMVEFLDLLDGRVNKKPNKFTIKLQDDMHEFTSSEEWSDIMSDFELYKQQLLKEGEKKGEERGRKEGEQNAISKMIKRLRKLSLTDSQILESLNEDYGSSFSSSELEQMLKSVE